MPYELKKFKNGYKVCKKIGDKKCYSNRPLNYKTAYKQRQAIGISESLSGGDLKIYSSDKKLHDFIDETIIEPDVKYLMEILEEFLKESCKKDDLRAIAFHSTQNKYVSKEIKKECKKLIKDRVSYEFLRDNDEESYLKYVLLEAFKHLIIYFNEIGINDYICFDRASGRQAGWFQAGTLDDEVPWTILYQYKDDNIYFRALAEIGQNYNTRIYIDTFCSAGGGKVLIQYLQDCVGKEKLLINFSNTKSLELNSVETYNTVNFYNDCGFMILKEHYNAIQDYCNEYLDKLSDEEIIEYYREFRDTDYKEWTELKEKFYNKIDCGGSRKWTPSDKKGDYVPADIYKLVVNILNDSVKYGLDEEYKDKEDEDEEEVIGGVKAPFGRIGGKSKLKKIIVEKYFPKNYENMTYVEPFIGAGSVYFYKEPSKKEVINDLDSSVIELFRGFKKYDGKDIDKDINGAYSKELFNKIKDSKPSTEYRKFIQNLILTRTSFFGKKQSYGIGNSRNTISANFSTNKIKDRLKDTEIYNKSYKDIIEKYDSPNTFFYLDPPYENSTGLYVHDTLPIKDVYDILKNIKGKFLISYNDSKEAKELFKDFNINYENTTYEHTKHVAKRIKKEMLISNYNNMEGGAVQQWDAFKKYLKKFNITENNYLINARIKAGNAGYDENKLFMADDGVHKLVYDSAVGKVKFGRVGYKDYIIYKFIAYFEKDAKKKKEAEDDAEKFRNRFQKSHKAMSIKHKLGNLSPNELALKILW